MNLSTLIFILIILAIVLVIWICPKTYLKGLKRLFVKDIAETPEGAEMIYDEKISEIQEAYNKASDSLKLAAGRLSQEEKKLANLKNSLQDAEAKCEAFVKQNKMQEAELYAEQREEIKDDITRSTTLVEAYTKAKSNAEEAFNYYEKTLRKIKREAKDVVENMKTKQQLNEIYDDMDINKSVKETDKLLEYVKTKNADLDASVEGGRTIYDSKLSTKIQRAEDSAKSMQTSDYLDSLKKKYNK